MLATMPPKSSGSKRTRTEISASEEERASFSSARTVLDTFVEQLLDAADPRSLIQTEVKKGILKNNQKAADQILATLREMDAIHTFAKRVAYINDRATKGAITQEVYRAFSLAIMHLDRRESKAKREGATADQTPLKWAYYWRRSNALVDELEKGGLVTYGDIEDLRNRFLSEPTKLQETIKQRIGGVALSSVTMSDAERARNQATLSRVIQTAEMLFDEEQARVIRYGHDLAAKLHDLGAFKIKQRGNETVTLTRGTLQTLAERMIPYLEKSIRAHFRGEKSDLTPEEVGVLGEETKSLMGFLIKSESYENTAMKKYLWNELNNLRTLEETVKLAREGLATELREGISSELSEKKHALESTLPGARKAELAQDIQENKALIQSLGGKLAGTAKIDSVSAADVLKYITALDTQETLQAADEALEVNPLRDLREKRRIAESLAREEQARGWTSKEASYATLRAEIKGRAMLSYATEQQERLGEDTESRRSAGKSSRLRHKRQSLIGELQKIDVFKNRLEPLTRELAELNSAEEKSDALFASQLEKLKARYDVITAKKKPTLREKSEMGKIESEIARISADWQKSKAEFRQKRERIERAIQPYQQSVDGEMAVRQELKNTEEELAKIARWTPQSRLERIRESRKRADELLGTTAPASESRAEIVEDEENESDEEKNLLNPAWRLLYRPGRKRGQGTGSIVDHVLARLAKDAADREARKAVRTEVRAELLDILNSQFGIEKSPSPSKLDETMDDLGISTARIEIADSTVMDFFTEIQKNVRSMFVFENDGPIIYWQEQRLRVPKFLAIRLAEHLMKEITDGVNKDNQWSDIKKDLSNRGKLAKLEPVLKDITYLLSLKESIDAYTPRFNRPKMSREERDAKRESEDDEKRRQITQQLLPTLKARIVSNLSTLNDSEQEATAKSLIEEMFAEFDKDAIADDVRNALYFPYSYSEAFKKYEDEYGYDSRLDELLSDAFDELFPKSILKYSSPDEE